MKLQSKIFIFTLLFLIIGTAPITADDDERLADSLVTYISNIPDDSNKVNLYNDLSGVYRRFDYTKATDAALRAKELGQRIKYPKGVGYSFKNLGLVQYYTGEYVEALTYWKRSLSIFDSINYKTGTANLLGNIGAIYYQEADYNVALDYYLKALPIAEEINDSLRIVTLLNNIGAIYVDKNIEEKALEYSLRAFNMAKDHSEMDALATAAINAGSVYLNQDSLDLALEYFEQSMNAMEGKDGIIFSMIMVSQIHIKKKEYLDAIDILQRAIDIAIDMNSLPSLGQAFNSLGATYEKMGENDKALLAFHKAAQINRNVNANNPLEKSYVGLTQIYSRTEKYDSAYKYQSALTDVHEKLYQTQKEKQFSNAMFNYQIDRKENEIGLLKKEQEIADLTLNRQRWIMSLIGAGFISVIIFLIVVSKQKRVITREKERSEELLLNILPYEIAEELKEQGKSDAKSFNEASVLFTDFKGFTGLSEVLSASDLVKEINIYFKVFDRIITKYNIEKIKTIGDAYMAAGGLPVPDEKSTKRVILAALEMQHFVIERQKDPDAKNSRMFDMRVGIHTGPVVAGIVGVKKFQYDVWGDTVNTASRMESHGEIKKVNISEFAYQKIKDDPDFIFTPREKLQVKGKGEMQMYFVDLKEPLAPITDFSDIF